MGLTQLKERGYMNHAEKREAIAAVIHPEYEKESDTGNACLDCVDAGKKADAILKICQPDTENLPLLTGDELRETVELSLPREDMWSGEAIAQAQRDKIKKYLEE